MGALLLAALFIALLVTVYARSLNGARRQVFIRRLPWYVLLGSVMALALAGRLHWLTVVFAAIVPVLGRMLGMLRYLPMFAKIYKMFGGSTPTAGQSSNASDAASEVESLYLRMRLDHSSGAMNGTVLSGTYQGHTLADLTLKQLLDLYAECRHKDAESVALLAAYLDREHSEWRASHDTNSEQDGHQGRGFSDTMSQAEAAEILGVTEDADDATVRAAHRRLMQKFHPDRGGSTFLAAKINEAKQRLMESR